MAFFTFIFRRAFQHGVVDRQFAITDVWAYSIVFLLYNAAFLFAFVRSGSTGRWFGAAFLAVGLLAALVSFPSFPEAPATFLPWLKAGVSLSVFSTGGLLFAAARGAAVLCRRVARGRASA